MKKVKFYKKPKRKLAKKYKTFLIKVSLYFTILILIIILIIFVIFKFARNKIKDEEIIGPNEIMYKGSKMLKTQLLDDYFSRISIEEQKKDNEREELIKLFNLTDYSNEPNIKNKCNNEFLNYFSVLNNKSFTKIDTFTCIYFYVIIHIG